MGPLGTALDGLHGGLRKESMQRGATGEPWAFCPLLTGTHQELAVPFSQIPVWYLGSFPF